MSAMSEYHNPEYEKRNGIHTSATVRKKETENYNQRQQRLGEERADQLQLSDLQKRNQDRYKRRRQIYEQQQRIKREQSRDPRKREGNLREELFHGCNGAGLIS